MLLEEGVVTAKPGYKFATGGPGQIEMDKEQTTAANGGNAKAQ